MNEDLKESYRITIEEELKSFFYNRRRLSEINAKIKLIKLFYLKELSKVSKLYVKAFENIIVLLINNLDDISLTWIADKLNELDVKIINGYNMKFINKPNKISKVARKYFYKGKILESKYKKIMYNL